MSKIRSSSFFAAKHNQGSCAGHLKIHPVKPSEDPLWLKICLITMSLIFVFAVLVIPLVFIFAEAFSKGIGPVLTTLSDPDALSALRLTLIVVALTVPFNLFFGLVASWLIAKHHFWGKSLLVSLIDLPVSVPPVVAGLMYVLVFGAQGWLGPWLSAHHITIIFALPAMVLTTIFVTLPFIARELIPLMQAQGTDEEEASVSLGASGLQTFFRVTTPNIRWALASGVLLCNARAMGEFGAVSIVSGRIRGLTNTLPLHVEILYNEYNFVGAFTVAGLLCIMAVITLGLKVVLEIFHPNVTHNEKDRFLRHGEQDDLL